MVAQKHQPTTHIHLISESTGSLAEHLVSTVLSQFPDFTPVVHEHRFCNSTEALRTARSKFDCDGHLIVLSALTSPRLRRSLLNWCDRRDIPHRELVQPLIEFVQDATGIKPARDASKSHVCDDAYFRRIEAWEFTLQHDDSRRIETASEADLILLGVSRVGKTPISTYLGAQGYRVANISLAKETSPPEFIANCSRKCVGLTMDASRLAAIRKRRMKRNQFARAGGTHNYTNVQSAHADVHFAETFFRKLQIPCFDVTDLTVEESAAHVLVLSSRHDTIVTN